MGEQQRQGIGSLASLVDEVNAYLLYAGTEVGELADLLFLGSLVEAIPPVPD